LRRGNFPNIEQRKKKKQENEKCIPKYHKEHIPISEDGDEFLSHTLQSETLRDQ